MRKTLSLLSALILTFSMSLFSQTEKDYTCLVIDYEADSLLLNAQSFESTYNCLEVNGIMSAQILNEIFDKIPQKENIEKLVLTNYSDKNLPVSITSFSNLKHITVASSSQINFKKLFRQLKKLPHLSILELDDNEKALIPSYIKQLQNLNTVIIRNYDFVDGNVLFKSLSFLPYLKHFSLTSTGRIVIEKNVPFPNKLISLDLSDNWISILPQQLSKNKNLEILDISDNNFRDTRIITSIIGDLPLKHLKVTCFDIIDSLSFLKSFPNTELHLSIYRDFQKSVALKNTLNNQVHISFIDKYYKNTIFSFIGNPEIDRKKYEINAQKTHRLVYKTGSVINIPDNAFVDANGIAVKGDISIYYREFNDMTDILANGVSLQYDSAGVSHHFQTAGMFEIYAAKGNQEVFLAQDKKIQIDFSTIDTAAGFNLYRLDDATSNWQFNTPLVNDVSFPEMNPNPAYRLYNRLLLKDLSFFEDRYKDTSYARTKLIPAHYYTSKRKAEFSFFKIKRASKYVNNKDIKKLPTFYFDKINYGTYKELLAFRSYVWVYAGNMNKKEFGKTYITRKKWTDIRITYEPDDFLFTVELKSPHEFTSFKAYPVRGNMTPELEKYEKQYLRMDKRYQKILARVQTKFDKKLNKTLAQKQKDTWEQIYKLMTPEEKAMSKEDWLDYAQRCLKIERDSMNLVSVNAIRSFQIDGFGIWNIDKIFKMKDRLEILASFKNALDNPIYSSTIYAVDMTDKTIIQFPAESVTNMSINKSSETAFFMFCTNGNVAIVDKHNVKNATASARNGENINFTAYEIDPTLLTTGDLRSLLGM